MIRVWFWFASPQMHGLQKRCGLANHHTRHLCLNPAPQATHVRGLGEGRGDGLRTREKASGRRAGDAVTG